MVPVQRNGTWGSAGSLAWGPPELAPGKSVKLWFAVELETSVQNELKTQTLEGE